MKHLTSRLIRRIVSVQCISVQCGQILLFLETTLLTGKAAHTVEIYGMLIGIAGTYYRRQSTRIFLGGERLRQVFLWPGKLYD